MSKESNVALILDSRLHVVMEGSDEAVQLWGTSNLQEDIKQPFSANQVEGLGQIYEGHVEGFAMFSAFLL